MFVSSYNSWNKHQKLHRAHHIGYCLSTTENLDVPTSWLTMSSSGLRSWRAVQTVKWMELLLFQRGKEMSGTVWFGDEKLGGGYCWDLQNDEGTRLTERKTFPCNIGSRGQSVKATNILHQANVYPAEDTCMYGVPNEAAVAGGREHKGKQVARLVSRNRISSLHCLRQIAGLDRLLVWHSTAFLVFLKISIILCKPYFLVSYRITESLRLGKTPKIIKSNRSSCYC